MKDSLPSQASILVVGSGPAGLSLGLAAINKGVDDVLIVEKRSSEARAAFKLASRANVLHAGTLEELDETVDGVVESILKEALIIKSGGIYERGSKSPIMPGDFTFLPSRFNQMTVIPQSKVEAILESHLNALQANVQYDYEFLTYSQTQDAQFPLTVQLKFKGSEEPKSIKCKFLVGADGWSSKVRNSAGIDFPGDSYATRYLLGDVKLKDPLWPHSNKTEFKGCSYLGPHGPLLILPSPGGLTRIVADDKTFDPKQPNLNYHGFSVAESKPTIEEIQAELDKRGPEVDEAAKPSEIVELIWSSRFRVHHRLAETFRKDRVLLVGDAAHIHSPAGGQGMNLGIKDALTLGVTLASILTLPPSPGLDEDIKTRLENWSRERRAKAENVVKFTDRATKLTTISNPILIWLRNHFMRFMSYWFPDLMKRSTYDMAGLKR